MATGNDKPDNGNNDSSYTRQLVNEALSLGFAVVIWVVIGVVLDNVFKTAPVFVIVGVFMALATVFYFLWRIIRIK
jgi:F0F1-type ATP synthase assembly protein I